MGGVPPDVMEKLKNLFRRKNKPAAGASTGTKTEMPKPSETAPAAPVPAQTPHEITKAPSSSDPTVPPAGAAPLDVPKAQQQPTEPMPVSDPAAAASGGPKPQASEPASAATTKAPTSTTA